MKVKINTEIPGPNSKELAQKRQKYVANGLGSVCGVFIEKADGSNLIDVDGNVFIDYAGGIGTMNVGHSHPRVVVAMKKPCILKVWHCFLFTSCAYFFVRTSDLTDAHSIALIYHNYFSTCH